jgi:hypothetical protein
MGRRSNTKSTIIQRDMDEVLRQRIQDLPRDVQLYILSFVPKPPNPKPLPANTYQHVKKLQNSPKRTAMDLKGLEDFVLK